MSNPTFQVKANKVPVSIYTDGTSYFVPRQAVLNSCMRNGIITEKVSRILGNQFIVPSCDLNLTEEVSKKVKLISLDTAIRACRKGSKMRDFNEVTRKRFVNLEIELKIFKSKRMKADAARLENTPTEEVQQELPTPIENKEIVVVAPPMVEQLVANLDGQGTDEDHSLLESLICNILNLPSLTEQSKVVLAGIIGTHGVVKTTYMLREAEETFTMNKGDMFIQHLFHVMQK